ncbi:MAG: threonine synthase [Zetaproteobacteria bacterium CG06_land_8_20_14_3_00_59_53]|nr:MAG: threonine synthase [Zetaproteobacteria bacterium CG11_big_fil_rev_8_21_14_0_20_59_439]PIU71140.1 MAG: threonine synthase [Zetaproteobacteria bacterium CG06_land_8_20_14_3_00_59_53]PIY46238.1 MAG: threonine synthase [Zetaproteobacteria bacterium CG_4_10_14_0_8_um_filter_59_127]PJC16724.1 MAG: threonine synthase [Zetaproteobacteria bacterium CG_4_9_14_0_2_um_filter_59_191]
MLYAGRWTPDTHFRFMKLLLVTDALLAGEGRDSAAPFTLHPALDGIRTQLDKRRRQWFRCANHNPLGWYAALVGTEPAALLAARCTELPAHAMQVWVASPYHAMLGRDTVRLLPEVDFPWGEEDSIWLCNELNPLLHQDGMSLHPCEDALLLASKQQLDVQPAAFADIAGHLLPNRHPAGRDGGRLMRLLSEIQMLLHSSSQPTREGKPGLHGLWLWGACEMSCELPIGLPPVASLNPVLQSLEHDHGAELTITEAEHLPALLASGVLPPAVLLAGAGHAVLLQKSVFPRLGKDWKAQSPAHESELFLTLRSLTHVT